MCFLFSLSVHSLPTPLMLREAIGTVSVSGVASSPMDMREMLNKKAEEKGATAYQITEARSGDTWHATAELYK